MSPPGRAPVTTRARHLMGTLLRVELPGGADEQVFADVFDEVARLEAILSNWRSDSELSRLNRAAAGGPVPCSADLFRVVEEAVFWAERTGGAFDPSVEPIVRALGLIGEALDAPFETGVAEVPSTPSTLPGNGTAFPAVRERAAAPPVGWRGIRLDRARRTVAFATPGMGIDLGGIGKGFALDAAARVLRRHGHRDALLDFGGQILALGAPPGQDGWLVGIADPADRDVTVQWLLARDLSLSTSGNGERRGAHGEGHIIDPHTGRTAEFTGAVTVAAAEATQADALSTALFVMGERAGLRWARRRDAAALFVRRLGDGRIDRHWTGAFSRRIHLLDAAGDAHDLGAKGRRGI